MIRRFDPSQVNLICTCNWFCHFSPAFIAPDNILQCFAGTKIQIIHMRMIYWILFLCINIVNPKFTIKVTIKVETIKLTVLHVPNIPTWSYAVDWDVKQQINKQTLVLSNSE